MITAHTNIKVQLDASALAVQKSLSMAKEVVKQLGSRTHVTTTPGIPTNAEADPFQSSVVDPWNSYGSASAASAESSANRDKFGRFMLYDEKVHLNNKMQYDPKHPATWLQEIHDYVGGRTMELDALIDWVETQTEEITIDAARQNYPGCLDCAPMDEIALQLWSFLGPLVKDNADKVSLFRNCPRHNGIEAWRRISEAINDDKTSNHHPQASCHHRRLGK